MAAFESDPANASPWEPLFKADGWGVLRSDFPPTVRRHLVDWLIGNSDVGHRERFQVMMAKDFGFAGTYEGTIDFYRLQDGVQEMSDEELANLLDYVLFNLTERNQRDKKLEALNEWLRLASSKWTAQVLDADRPGLVEVLPSGVQTIAEGVAGAAGTASDVLLSAWRKAYGVNTDPSNAYHRAVVAVEIAALQVVKVSKPDATLANVFTQLENQSKWSTILHSNDKAPAVETIAKMMRMLWRAQTDRHGKEDYEGVSLSESRAAVLLAATLVGWLLTGVLRDTSAIGRDESPGSPASGHVQEEVA